jgi:hypothetical protein
MFPETINTSVYALRNIYRGRRNCVLADYPIIEITRYEKNKEVSIKLFYSSSTNTFEIQPPNTKYYNKISFFDFKNPEHRWVRNKDVLFPFIKDLKKCGLWDLVSNKDFLIINEHNEKIDVEKRIDILNKILNNK